MDFDDLDEAVAEREAAGELDDAAKAAMGLIEAPDDYKGGIMWPLPQNSQFPGLSKLPEKLRANFNEKKRAPKIRFFFFYGAGHSVPFWAQWMVDFPEFVDVTTYEWPSHGSREDELLPSHVDGVVDDAMLGLESIFQQHAKGGGLEGAPWAIAGHSIGVLIALGVAKRAKIKDAEDFIRIFNPQPYWTYHSAKAKAEEAGKMDSFDKHGTLWRMLQMWMDDIKLQNHTKDEGWHMFKNAVHVFVAMGSFASDTKEYKALVKDPMTKAFDVERRTITNSKPESAALWDFEMYEDWPRWAANGMCHMHKIDADHTEVPRKKEVLDILLSTLKQAAAS